MTVTRDVAPVVGAMQHVQAPRSLTVCCMCVLFMGVERSATQPIAAQMFHARRER